uniref:A-kinase-interacting protein 1 isoform X3 n=1 Tax=Panthera onca TaxID=9690 RepID=UPI002952E3EC|nr:A-kinase-interacting protein 1 isoform X3 [Panthera onca]
MTSEDMAPSPGVPPQAQNGRPRPRFDSDFHAPHAAKPRPCAWQLARQPALPGRRRDAKGVVGAGPRPSPPPPLPPMACCAGAGFSRSSLPSPTQGWAHAPGKREERQPTLSASFRTMAEFMDYTSSQCGKYYSSVLEDGGAAHVSRYHRRKSELHLCCDRRNGQRKDTSLGLGVISHASECALEASQQPAENISKDLYIEVYPGTYSVTVGANDLTKTHVVAVDSGQSVDLVFAV